MNEKILFSMQDTKYKEFHMKLIPNINPETIIGIRTPVLRSFAKQYFNSSECASFMSELPHKYYEENNLHAFLIEQIKDYETVLKETDRFLPYIDNWATCDMFYPKVFVKNTDKLIVKISEWIKSDKVFTVRYAVNILMRLYLDDDFSKEYPKLVSGIELKDYYINMVSAWYFATALSKQYDNVISYLTENRLSVWVHNKTIQKACESKRIDSDTKLYLRTLKRK